MARARARKKEVWYSADFETDTTNIDSTFVWAWGVIEMGKSSRDDFRYGTSLSAFFEYVFTLDWTPVLWFHNLKFDGSFIVDWLLREGYEYVYCRDVQLKDNQFTTMISDMGQWYAICVCKNDKLVKFQNSLLKIPMSVKQIAKTLKLDLLKGDIDYSAYRKEGGELSEDDKEYLFRDVYIVARAMNELYLEKGLTAMTVGSDCLSFYKEQLGFKRFEKIFPVLDDYADSFIRKAYKGGWVYKNPSINRVKDGITVDYNSMYPSQMHSQSGNYFPCGKPEYFRGQYVENNKFPLYVQRIATWLELKPGYLPTVQLKNHRGFLATEYIKTTMGEIVELTLTDVDLELLQEHYECDITYIDGYMFRARKKLFDYYIDYWAGEKIRCEEIGDTIGRQRSKYFMNNLYGKFGTHPNSGRKEPYLNEEQDVKFKMVEDTRNPVYIPVACYTTAYARREVITAAQKNYKHFCYADTDSLHLTCREEDISGIRIHKTSLCAWKCEGKWTEAIFVRAKTYMEHIDGKYWLVKCAGMPDNVKEKVTPANFKSNSVFEGKLRQKRVKGGVVLVPTTFKIS